MLYINECLTWDTPVKLVSENPRKSLFKKSEPKAFFKDFNHAEFIGEELCNIRNIRCSHYFIAGLTRFKVNKTLKRGEIDKYCQWIGIASYDFRDSDKEYKYLNDYDVNSGNGFLEMLEKTNNYHQLYKDMLELMALDIYMGQADRSEVNVMFEEDQNNNIRLAPLYDFEFSLNSTCIDKDSIYRSCLYNFGTIDEVRDFIRKYPEFRDILGSYLDINLIDVISRSYSRRGLVIPSDKWSYYIDFEKNRDEVIKKIIK